MVSGPPPRPRGGGGSISTKRKAAIAAPPAGVQDGDPRPLQSSSALLLFHLFAFCLHLFVFLWYFGRRAAKLHGASGFGGFTRYYGFWLLTIQMVGFLCSTLTHLFPGVKQLQFAADDILCASFGHSNVLFSLFLLLCVAGRQHLYNHARPPLWAALFNHVGTTALVWVDIMFAERSFRKRGFYAAMGVSVSYVAWLHFCASFDRKYPYVFLNHMSQPEGFIAIAIPSVIVASTFYGWGHKISGRGRGGPLKKLQAKSF